MALTTLQSAFGTVEYDPDVIDEDTVLGFLDAGQDRSVAGMEEEESDELPPDDLPPEVAAMLDNGADQDVAIEVLRPNERCLRLLQSPVHLLPLQTTHHRAYGNKSPKSNHGRSPG